MTDIQLKTFHFPYPHHPAPVVHDVVPSYTRVTSRCDEHSHNLCSGILHTSLGMATITHNYASNLYVMLFLVRSSEFLLSTLQTIS